MMLWLGAGSYIFYLIEFETKECFDMVTML